jgi:16S rRNA G966 N2-methylase RsmD|tara:strand:+ start:90 stop:260 length:171 start_codon:yes stop_codon:yes gene_type:complete
MYKIKLTMEFKTRPTKAEVEHRLFDLLRDGFVLKQKEEYEKEKQLVGKGQQALPQF